ncbi:MAG: bifunctional (p)ppGpp synthetase/guanosine-3',5'-bis(diphosphate) 3'-pyrophosphohydrolase [Ignavibacteria bacterium]|nr:bifunctional (p)ppGpp synthetase/guanosine-3',5'-bis(diphosphate) 3'-pyrophosphohydrolase [Ignavibacteria bacterium]
MKYLHTYENHKLSKFIHKVKKAKEFATKAHKGIYRKGFDDNGEKIPYIIHPDSVAKIVHEVENSEHIAHLIAAAYLHDTVEETNVTLKDIQKEFGDIVMQLVNELTSDKEKLKISGKEEYLIDKMIGMSNWALVIKLADRLHNVSDFKSIMAGNNEKRKKWAKEYAQQTKNIIEELEWYRDLSDTQQELIKRIKDKLKIVTEE